MRYQRIIWFVLLLVFCLFAVVSTQPFNLLDIQIHHHSLINKGLLVLYNHAMSLVGILFLSIGFYAYVKKPQSAVIQRFFHLMCISGLAITFAKPSIHDVLGAKIVENVAVGFAPYFLIRFIEYFPSPHTSLHWKLFKRGAFVLGIIILFLYVFPAIPSSELIRTVALTGNIIIALLVCSYRVGKQWFSQTKRIQNQLRLLLFGFVFSFAPVLIGMIWESVFQLPIVPYEFLIIPLGLFPLTLAYLLTKQEIVDFKYVVKQSSPLVLSFVITVLILTAGLSFSADQLLAFLIGGIIFAFFYKGFKHLEAKYVINKLQAIQQERQYILQQLNTTKLLPIYSERIAQLIHKMFNVEGVCVVWSQPTLTILYDSGLFQHSQTVEKELLHLFKQQQNQYGCVKHSGYYTLPLMNGAEVTGMIVVGQKVNLTKWDRQELILLKSIHTEAIQLFFHAQTLQKIDKVTQEAQQASQQQTNFHRQLLEELENERERLSIFLHDEVLQELLLIFRESLSEKVKQPIQQTIATVRKMCSELYPMMVKELGLTLSLQSLQENTQRKHAMIVHLDQQIVDDKIPSFLGIHLFRIVKELVNNCVKHAEATDLLIAVYDKQGDIQLVVEDNGCGFVVPNNMVLYTEQHFGLVTIQKKIEQLQGTFMIESNIGQGTTITITIPLKGSE